MTDEDGVYFLGGHIARRSLVGILAYPNTYESTNEEYTIFYSYYPEDDEWMQWEVDQDIVSLQYERQKKGGAWHLLSKRGIVITLDSSGESRVEIAKAGTGPGSYGYLNEIRLIGSELYACGMCRQVYLKKGKTWTSFDKGIIASDDSVEYNFQSIDGTGPDNIYAVGWKGEIYHFNGKRWTQYDSPTNIDLNCVRCDGPDLVYICGEKGIFLKGTPSSWEIYQDDAEDDFWGLDIYDGVPYIASRSEVYTFDGNGILPVDTKIKKIDSGGLHSSDGVLWSIGNNSLLWFDGARWRKALCPDN